VGLQGFEERVERTVEGVFARAFRSKIKPIELGRRLCREMDNNRSIDVRGRTIVPNSFTFYLSPADVAPFAEIHSALIKELVQAAHEHASDERYAFMGPVVIELHEDPEQPAGRFACEAHMLDGASLPVHGVLVMSDGSRLEVGGTPITIGRLPDCDIQLQDANASRRHAEIRVVDGRHQITDLKSTNGTRVNGAPIGSHNLSYGDLITVGGISLRYEAS
jgi:Protein of unknown function (DUF3662)/FHA domain